MNTLCYMEHGRFEVYDDHFVLDYSVGWFRLSCYLCHDCGLSHGPNLANEYLLLHQPVKDSYDAKSTEDLRTMSDLSYALRCLTYSQ